MEEIPGYTRDTPQTWGVNTYIGSRLENRSEVDTGVTVTQQKGDVWCVEVTPGGGVHIYHNYDQPWGAPVFTLPDTAHTARAGIGLWNSIISVVQHDTGKTSSLNYVMLWIVSGFVYIDILKL